MSLAIDIDKVEAVLLADGWHYVKGKSFGIDTYDFVEGKNAQGDFVVVLGGGVCEGVVSIGAMWREEPLPESDPLREVFTVACPLTSILALRVEL